MTKSLGNPNHPKKGSIIKVEPIRDIAAIERIKTALISKPRDYCLFVLGINTAYRANELLSIKCGHVAHLKIGDNLELLQTKTGKRRVVAVNSVVVPAIQSWLRQHPNPEPDAPLFQSRVGGALKVSTVSNMVKDWCGHAGLKGKYGSHSMRKTWGFHQARAVQGPGRQMVMPRLMRAFGHSSEAQTIQYLCIQDEEVASLFMSLRL